VGNHAAPLNEEEFSTMFRTPAVLSMAVLISAAAHAATTTTTVKVDSATVDIVGGTVKGTATFNPGIPDTSGAFSATVTVGATAVSGPFTIKLAGGTLAGTVSLPTAILSSTSAVSGGTMVISGSANTGTYANASGTIPLTGTGGIGASGFTVSFSGTGAITTGGASGGGGGGGGGGTTTSPVITAVENNYGLVPQGLPNYGLAPSTLFFIQGTNLANTTTALLSSSAPGLQTTVSGVTVTVTSGTTTLPCPLYYLSPTQIDAVLPGSTPTGTATITVNNNGTQSTAFSITVVQSAFGILSYNGSLAAAYDANNNLISASNAANPGQAIVLWGSGVGFDAKADDKVFPQPQDDLTNIPVQAYVGGVQATLAYRGRSQYPGVDQVVLTIPNSVPTGCYVSLMLVSGNIVSNSVTIPIAASGRTCSDSNTNLTPDQIQILSTKTTIKEGILTISQNTSISSSGTTNTNAVGGYFQSVSFAGSAGSGQVSIGSCLVTNSLSTASSTATTTGLDAGSSISVNGPAGSVTLGQLTFPGLPAGFYSTSNGTVPSNFIPAAGGAFTFDNGSGGKDVQHFSATLNEPAAFTWTNASQVASVTRNQGATVTWTGGAANTYVEIFGSSSTTVQGKSVSVSFICQAPVSAGQFAIPVPVLLSLPAGSGSLGVGNDSNLQTFTAPGLDLGLLLGSNTTSKLISYN
jgi:uncharacterized protein (TIGR03437 family)